MPNLVVQHTHWQCPKVSIGLIDAAAIGDYIRKGDSVDRDEVDFLNANGVLLGMGGGNQGSILEEMANKSCGDHGENDFSVGVNFHILYRVLDCWGGEKWLPRMDSNHDKQIQNLQCYRYTTRQWSFPQNGAPSMKLRSFGGK